MTHFLPSLDQARTIVAGNEAFESSVIEIDGHRVHHFGYLLPGYMDFEDPVPGSGLKAHELRGLTFVEDPAGAVSRHLMLAKFYALNQTKGYMLRDVQDKRIVATSEKLDGSLVRFVPIGGRLLARTKTSFTGPHANLANELLGRDRALQGFVLAALADGLAPLFELVSPTWKIVLDYPEDRLRLIQIREEATGIPVIDVDNHPLVRKYGVETASVPGIRSVADLLELQMSKRGVEGWVSLFEDGQMMKTKTIWYDDMHDHFFEKNHSTKKLVAMVVNETMDDAIAKMDEAWPTRGEAEVVNILVSRRINEIVRSITKAVASFQGDEEDNAARKAFTQLHAGDPLLGCYMSALKTPDPRSILAIAKGVIAKSAKTEDSAVRLVNALKAA